MAKPVALSLITLPMSHPIFIKFTKKIYIKIKFLIKYLLKSLQKIILIYIIFIDKMLKN